MKRDFVILALACIISKTAYSQGIPLSAPSDNFLQVKAFAGAGVFLHRDGGPNFSRGCGYIINQTNLH